jgi:ubiquitin-conjugating enzyme E2 H
MASSPSPDNHRKNMDVTKLVSSSHEVTVNGLNDFVVKFHGPKDTPYEGGVWNVQVHVHESYPYRPPTIRFINTVYHPNIQENDGTVCLDVIAEEWTEKYDLMHIFDYFLPQLFALPEPSDPYNIQAANLLMASPENYKRKVKEYINIYATEEALATWLALH